MAGMSRRSDPDAFSRFHPAALLFYFCAVLFFTMFSMHPVILAVSFVSGFCYSVLLNGRKALRFNLAVLLPAAFAVAFLNPLFNHAGATILFYLNENPVTLESMEYGGIYALAFAAVIVTFSCFNKIMTSDKLMYLFGRLAPVLSLMFSMTLRFVPRYKAQIGKIARAQECVGMDPFHGNILRRAGNGVRILSIFVTWALENAVESADSMKARGFGLRGRTSFSVYAWGKRDKILLAAELSAFAVALAGLVSGRFGSEYLPAIRIAGLDAGTFPFYAVYAAFCLLPVAADIEEVLEWNRSRSAG